MISDSFFRRFENDKGYHIVASNVLGFLAQEDTILVAIRMMRGSFPSNNRGDPKRGLSLLGSYDGGTTLTDVRFPGNLTEQSYTILDLGSGSTFVNVKHSANWGNLYVSNKYVPWRVKRLTLKFGKRIYSLFGLSR